MPLNVPDSNYNSDLLKIYAKQVRKAGAMLQLTIIPYTYEQLLPLNTISDAILTKIASDCLEINNMGVPVLLNYAPDMNTHFHKYGLNPIAYTQGFRAMSNKIKEMNAKLTGIFYKSY